MCTQPLYYNISQLLSHSNDYKTALILIYAHIYSTIINKVLSGKKTDLFKGYSVVNLQNKGFRNTCFHNSIKVL